MDALRQRWVWDEPAHAAAEAGARARRASGVTSGRPLVRPALTRDRVLFESSEGRAAGRCEEPTRYVDLEDIYAHQDRLVPAGELPTVEQMVRWLARQRIGSSLDLDRATAQLRKRPEFREKLAGGHVRRSQLLFAYRRLKRAGLPAHPGLERHLVKKASKSQSGVLVITVLTSPYPAVGDRVQSFSCKWNCYYCPNQPGQPRSYLHDEPAVMRANNNGFDPVMQFTDRAGTLAQNGHPVDKVELLVLGGTWASYPLEYRKGFVRDLYYAANTFDQRKKRPRLSLAAEQALNETAACKIIGLTLETRPDCVDFEELRRFRRYGCTRVQLGVQHTDDRILRRVNRGHGRAHAARAVRLLKDSGFKVDIHLMPLLPGASPAANLAMFRDVLLSPDLQVDQWKIYPCEITPWTVIKKWYDEGKYVPYSEGELIDVLTRVKAKVHPWIRLNRVIRDIPNQYIYGGGVDRPNLRQDIGKRMAELGWACQCIRCREVGGGAAGPMELVERRYASSGGAEVFLSWETPDRATLFAFLRLRLPGPGCRTPFAELAGAAYVRELHVYGQLLATEPATDGTGSACDAAQHAGLGRSLMRHAEGLAAREGYARLAVISGVGTRTYYAKFGYELRGEGRYSMRELGLADKARGHWQTVPYLGRSRRWPPPLRAKAAAVVAVCRLAGRLGRLGRLGAAAG